jgi:hypothetical protein
MRPKFKDRTESNGSFGASPPTWQLAGFTDYDPEACIID